MTLPPLAISVNFLRFHRIGPLGRFGLVLAMSICTSVCPYKRGLSLALRSHDQFEAYHCIALHCIWPAATISWQQRFAGATHMQLAAIFGQPIQPKFVAKIIKLLGTSVPAIPPFCNSVENLHTLIAAYFPHFHHIKKLL